MTFLISVCIPVYNCALYLGQALDSILPQIGDRVEVVIYDGGSTDNTPRIVEPYLAAFQNLQYHRGDKRGGIDADMATCVALATGEYCWLFSGDDVMRPMAIQRAIELIRSKLDVYICQHTLCDIDMNARRDYPVLASKEPFIAELSVSPERQEWFMRAVNTEALFSFMSGLVVRREKWLSGRLIPEFDGSCWAHVARLFELIGGGLSVCYVPEVWLDQRGGNDSFREDGVVERYRLAIDGFHRMGGHFFSHQSIEAFHIRRVIRHEFQLKTFLHAKMMVSTNSTKVQKTLLDRLVKQTYSDLSLGSFAKGALYRLMGPRAIRVAIWFWWCFHTKSPRYP